MTMKDHTIPIWCMRQAGRYHKHYQKMKENYSFMQLCKEPKLATEVTLGPIEDFHFDSAILFSDLLFPLEFLGMGLDYLEGPPRLGFHLKSLEDFKKISLQGKAKDFFRFQGEALTLLRQKLPPKVALIGFIGAPFTLFSYAVEGSHQGQLIDTKLGLFDGRWEAFLEKLMPELFTNACVQLEGGAESLALFDTAAGEIDPILFNRFVVPVLQKFIQKIKDQFPHKKIIYYSKWTNKAHLEWIKDSAMDILAIDWRFDLTDAFELLAPHQLLQGNLDPGLLFLPWEELKNHVCNLAEPIVKSPYRERWIFNLGHGILPKTPEENVRKLVQLVHSL